MDTTKSLIEAMVNYGHEGCWCDSEIIDALVGCGISEDDFACCGYGDFVKEYFAN